MVNFGVELPTTLYIGTKDENNILCSGVYTSRDAGQTVNIIALNLGPAGKQANITLEDAALMIETALFENDIDYSEESVSLIITEYSVEDFFSEEVEPEEAAYTASLI